MLERFLHSTAIVLFVDLSCGRDAGSRRLCYSTPTDCEEGKKRTPVAPVIGSVPESPPLLPASPLLGLHTSLPDLSLTTSVCQSRQDFTHLLHNISSVCRKKKKKKKRLREKERQTNQFERPDKRNKPKVYFSGPSKWVLRYCITLFI